MLDSKEVLKIEDLIINLGDFALNQTEVSSSNKDNSGSSVTTEIDKKIEIEIRNLLEKITPDFEIYGEELESNNKKSRYKWFLDPIDGTRYFVQNIPLWSICLCLYDTKEEIPLLSFVYYPATKEFYKFENSQGYLNNVLIIKPKLEKPLKETNIILDTPALKDGDFSLDLNKNLIQNLYKSVYRVRNFGSGAINLCWVAKGVFDAYVKVYNTEKQFNDSIAGLAIAKGAGYDYKILEFGENKLMLVAKNEVLTQLESIVC